MASVDQLIDKIHLSYEFRDGDKVTQTELPFKLLVCGNFSAKDEDYVLEDASWEVSPVDVGLSRVMKMVAPCLTLRIPHHLDPYRDDALVMDFSPSRLEDFHPAGLVESLTPLREFIALRDGMVESYGDEGRDALLTEQEQALLEAFDASWDKEVANGAFFARTQAALYEQLDAVLHDKAFQKLEGIWRSLSSLAEVVNASENVELYLLDITKEGLLENFENALSYEHAQLYDFVYNQEYDQFGGRPYAAIALAENVTPGTRDIALIRHMSNIASLSHAVFFTSCKERFFGVDFSDLPGMKNLKEIGEDPQFRLFSDFRKEDTAKHTGLVTPATCIRHLYDYRSMPGFQGLSYIESVQKDGTSGLYAPSVFAFLACLVRNFDRYRMAFSALGDAEGDVGNITTECLITEHASSQLAALGFIPLGYYPAREAAVFQSAYSLHYGVGDFTAPQHAKDNFDLGEKLSSQIPYLMLVLRILQYVKVIQRDNLGSFTDPKELEKNLMNWIGRYVSDVEKPTEIIRAKRPLRRVRLEVRSEENSDKYTIKLQVIPHMKYFGSEYALSIEGKLA